jgi:hypothetical protein
MVSASEIGQSVILSVLLIIIFAQFWPLLPKQGLFSDLSWQLKTAVIIISGLLVIGPGQVAWEMITDSGY